MPAAFQLVVVGGGIAGLEVATGIGRRFRGGERVAVTLVDSGLAHVWKPTLHTVAAGTSYSDRQKIEYIAQAHRSGFAFVAGSLDAVDRAARRIVVAPVVLADDGTRLEGGAPRELAYDALVLALGSRANDFGIEGVAEHCLPIDDTTQARLFRRALRRHVLAAIQNGSEVNVAIVGGGATGVELAAELKQAIDLMAGYGQAKLPALLHVTLIESGPRLLAAFPDEIAAAAAANLAELGVDVRTAAKVIGADAQGFRFADGSRVDAGLRVWAAGVKAPDVLSRIEGLERTRIGQLEVGDDLRTTRDPALFALGDCARQTPADGSAAPPATAQAARQQARWFIRHFDALRQGRPVPPFRFRDRGMLVSLADYNGWGTLGRYTFGGGRWRGFSARLAHDLLYRQHQFELRGVSRGLLTWLRDGIDGLVSPPVRLD